MGEHPLWLGVPNTTLVLRILTLPAFDHPGVVRAWQNQSDSQWCVVSKRGNWRGGYLPGVDEDERRRELPPDEGRLIDEGMARLGIWSLPTHDERKGLDGWDSLLEMVDPSRYHVVHRWAPERGPFFDFCELLARAAQVKHGAA
jgi:hypothetical protein